MALIPDQGFSFIFELGLYDEEDPIEMELARDYRALIEVFKDRSEMDIHHAIQELVSINQEKHAEVMNGLLYAILTYHTNPGSPGIGASGPNNATNNVNGIAAQPNPNNHHSFTCANLARIMRLVARDSYSHVSKQARYFCNYQYFQKFRPAARQQLLWLVNHITEARLSPPHAIEPLYMGLLRQIRGGDTSGQNVQHAESTLRLLQSNQQFVDSSTQMIAFSCYSYLRIILDHSNTRFSSLRQQEVNYCVRLLREKFRECSEVGRDLIRALQDVSRIKEFEAIWTLLLYNPQELNPQLESIRQIMTVPSPKLYLSSRLSFDMEVRLLHILEHINQGQHMRNLGWFTERFLPTQESETLLPDIIRYICGVYHPTNAVLASSIVPRYALIWGFLNNAKSHVWAANIKLALFYDWLFFDSPRDSIMNIEPAILLVERSLDRAPHITAICLEFLHFTIENYHPPLRDYIHEHVGRAAQLIVEKGVIRSFRNIYRALSVDDSYSSIRECMASMFPTHLADLIEQAPAPSSSGDAALDNDDPLAPGGSGEGNNDSGDFDGSGEDTRSGLEWDDSGDESSLPHKEPKRHDAESTPKEPMRMDGSGAPSSGTPSSTLANGDEEDREEDEVMESSMDVEPNNKSSNQPPQIQSSTLLDWTLTDDGTGMSESGTGSNSYNASTAGTPDPEASLWIFGDVLLQSFKSAYEADPDSPETLFTFRQICEVYGNEAGVGVGSADMAHKFGQEICTFAEKSMIPESYVAVQEKAKSQANGQRAQDQDEEMEEDAGAMGALMACLWRVTEREGREGALRIAEMLLSCEATVDPSARLLSMWYLIGLVRGYRNSASSGAAITLEESLALYGSYLQNAAERDCAQAIDEEDAEEDQSERIRATIQEYLVGDLQKLQDRQLAAFDEILPLTLQYLPDYISRTESFLRMVIALAAPAQIYRLSLGLAQRAYALFSTLPSGEGVPAKDKKSKKKSDSREDLGSPASSHSSLAIGWEPRVGAETLELIGQTLEWDTFEQLGIWQLILSEFGGVSKAITGLLNASWVFGMTSLTRAEALSGILNLVRTLSLTPPDTRLGTTIARIASRVELVSEDMGQFCQCWIGQSARTYPDHLGAILLSLSDKNAAPVWEELGDHGVGSPGSAPTTPPAKITRSRIGSGGKRPKLTVKQRKEQGNLLRAALSLLRDWCDALPVGATLPHFQRVWSAQVRNQVLEALTEIFGVSEKEAWPRTWWIKDEDAGSQDDEDMQSRHSGDDEEEEDGDDDEEGGANANSSKKHKSDDGHDDESEQDHQSSDSDRRKKDKKRFGGAASGSGSSSRRNSPKVGSSSTMGNNTTAAAKKGGSGAGVLNSKSRSTRATTASATKKATPARKGAANRRRKISEDDDEEEEEEEEEEAQDDDEEEEEEAQDDDDDEDAGKDDAEDGSNAEESEEEVKGRKGKAGAKKPVKKAAAPAKRAATTRSQAQKATKAKPAAVTRSNRRTAKKEEEEEEGTDDEGGDQEDGDEDEEEDDDDDEDEEEADDVKKGKLPVYTQRRAAANANSKLLAGNKAATTSAAKSKATPKSRAKTKRVIVTDDEEESASD
ncbi:Integrator complex subunit 3 [Mortierella sp. AD031]|nr:Integrator complex subunit 3 [Mortierella sp. AD031]KAG0216892.1 Integrator complex subunit 3 [Mortierella sp. NVP41]